MPDNWKTYKLKDIATLQRGFDLPTKKRVSGNVPIVAASGIGGYHNQAKVKGPGVITGRSGTIGKVMFQKEDFWPLNTSLWVKDFHGNDVRFIYYLLSNFDFTGFNNGTSVPTLNRNDVHSVELNIPAIEEQKSIASILSALDDKIELNLQINKTLEEMAMALYKHWFIDFGPFRDGEFEDLELGEIPKGWEVKTIGELYNTTSGGTPSRKKPEYYEDGDINWVKSKELYGNFIIDTEEKINSLGLKKSSAKIIPPKSVLLAMYGATVGESSILSIEATCNQAICAILEKELSFIYVFLYLRIFKTDILNQATGSAQQNISQQIIKNISIVSPPAGLKVFNELEQYYALIEQNLFENQTLTQLRDTLLPKLISGEVRVKDAEKTLSEIL